MTNVTIIVPCYNEEQALPLYFKKAEELFGPNENYNFDFIFINDGSSDNTLNLLKDEAEQKSNVSYISFSRNFGQDPAIQAGLKAAKGDVVIPMDCDLQDPPELVFDMLKKYEEGYAIVQAQRTAREGDTQLKKDTSKGFYKVINGIAGKEILPPNVSQYKLLSRPVVDILNQMPEKMALLRSQVPFVGFKTAFVPFQRKERSAGKTKYNFPKMFSLAMRTIALSVDKPLDWAMYFTLIDGPLSFLASVVFLVLTLVSNYSTNGLANYFFTFLLMTIISILFFVLAIITGFISIQNLYLKEIMANTQNRPSYIVEEEYIRK
jgi:glycosyltransferase involved in cell wall biosynthesis